MTVSGIRLDTVERAIEDISVGKAVVVVDDEDRENEGDIVFAAQMASPELVAFTMTHCRGLLCVPLEEDVLDHLQLGQMAPHNTERMQTAFTVSVDAREGVTTGISAHDRAHTIQLLADPDTSAYDLVRPGHVFPLRAKAGGVLRRPGHTEAAVDLARLAGLRPAGVICEIVKEDGAMARLPELREFADTHGLALISIADLIAFRRRTEKQVVRVAEAKIPTAYGEFTAVGYQSVLDGTDHVALVRGDVGDGNDVLVRVHSECLTGDVFGSRRCDCGPQLHKALAIIQHAGRGILVYMRQEGRGIGLLNKLRAYELQDAGKDTVEANHALGFRADLRHYGIGAQILVDLGVKNLKILTNNPKKIVGIEGYGLKVVERLPLEVPATEANRSYLRTKREKLGHLFSSFPD